MKILLSAVFLLALVNRAAWAAHTAPQIFTSGGERMGIPELAKLASGYDVVLFGEYHNDITLHELELELLEAVFKERPEVALSLEMFERDTQTAMDNYLNGRLSEEQFLSRSRPWENYAEDYRPLVTFAKRNSLPVIASNIPRRIASRYAQEETLEGLGADAAYLPRSHSAPEGEYKRRFGAVMERNIGGIMPITPGKLDSYYKAQCLKDDTMAESIADFLRTRPGMTILHYQGDFHGRGRLGVAEKLAQIAPNLKIAVIAPVYTEDFNDIPELLSQNKNEGDFLIFTQRRPRL